MQDESDKNARHKASMEKQKAKVDGRIEQAQTERGVAVLLTGNGKGKSSSAFGMVLRALGYGQKIGVVQFIKGKILSGEEIFIRDHCPQVAFYQMGTGFTWNTQDRTGDIAAAEATWAQALPMLADESFDLVVLDEITYPITYKWLDVDVVIETVGEATWPHSMRAVKPGGRIVVSGSTSGAAPSADLQRLFFLQIQVLGSTMGSRDELADLATLCETTGLRPLIDRTLPLAEAREGFAAMAGGDIFGKIVFTV